jgi:hypothetical protein
MRKTEALLAAFLLLGAAIIFSCGNGTTGSTDPTRPTDSTGPTNPTSPTKPTDPKPGITDIKVEPGNVKIETSFKFTENATIVITVAQGEEVYYVLDKPDGDLKVELSRQNKYDGPIISQEILKTVDDEGKFVLKVRYLKVGGTHELIEYKYNAYLDAVPTLRLFGSDDDLVDEEEIKVADITKAKNIFVVVSNFSSAFKPAVKYKADVVAIGATPWKEDDGDIDTSDINGAGNPLASGDVFFVDLVSIIDGTGGGAITSEMRRYKFSIK